MNLIIDSREKDSRIQNCKDFYGALHKDMNVSVNNLTTGDYVYTSGTKSFAVEYKTTDDMLHSLKNQTVFEECANMAKEHDGCALLIEGMLTDAIDNDWVFGSRKFNRNKHYTYTYNMYKGAIYRLIAMGIPIYRCKTEDSAFLAMRNIAEKFFDDKGYAGIARQPKMKNADPVVILLSNAKGIGFKRAVQIKDYLSLNNIVKLYDCTVNDFTKVKGIGKTSAENIYNFIHGGR